MMCACLFIGVTALGLEPPPSDEVAVYLLKARTSIEFERYNLSEVRAAEIVAVMAFEDMIVRSPEDGDRYRERLNRRKARREGEDAILLTRLSEMFCRGDAFYFVRRKGHTRQTGYLVEKGGIEVEEILLLEAESRSEDFRPEGQKAAGK